MVRYFQSLVDRFMEGDLSGVASLYVHPLVVYAPEGIKIERTPEDTVHALAERLLSVRAGGAETIEVHLDATGPIQNERQPFDVTWTFLDKNGRWIGESQLRYFCRRRGGDIQIELVDIIRSFRARVMPYKTAVSH